MKTGLVLEGGSMRGMFTAGILDVFMEHDILFDGVIGVSAGAVFGCNYKSHQPGRALRYNKKYCRDKRYASFHSLFTTGNLFNEDFCYHELPERLDKFDVETFRSNPMEFYATATDVETGKAVYHKCETGDGADLRWFQASASLPLLSRIVTIGEQKLLDGGVADSIPLRKMQELGYERNVVILTQPQGFIKQKNKYMPLANIVLRHYPNMLRAMANRHLRYNKTTSYIEKQERAGKVFVFRPPQALNIKAINHDPAELDRVYQIGRKTGEEQLEKMLEFMKG